MAIVAEQPPSLTEAAADIIRERILDLTLEPGSRIDERALMERFELSRTPAREGLNRLVAEDLVEIRRNLGAFVCPLDLSQLREFFDAYIASERLNGFLCRMDQSGLESDLALLANDFLAVASSREYTQMTIANAAFHLRIAAACENAHVEEFSRRIHNHGRRLSLFTYRSEQSEAGHQADHQDNIKHDHEVIIRAIQDGDRQALIETLTRHAMLFHKRAFRVFGQTHADQFDLPHVMNDG